MTFHDPVEHPATGRDDDGPAPEPRLAMPAMPPLRLIARVERLWRRWRQGVERRAGRA
ncbi:hypothetical protein [Alloalcanivorax xenomutans]|uniref:hypothetical protein n=1 Tax=Alloalcanivorax xenomutans TaxID=1094342 RepID=UPI003C5B9AC9